MRFLSTLLASILGTLIAIAFLFALFFFFIVIVSVSVDNVPAVQSGSILVLEASGDYPDLAADDPFLRLATGASPQDLNRFRTNLRKAAADERIAGVWLRVGDLASSWATLQEMRQALLEFRDSGKPLYASAPGFYLDEAGYFLASTADSVFLSPEGLFEFNGFHITAEFYASLLDKLSIEPQVVRAGEFKSAVEPFTRTDLSPENRAQLEALLSDWNAVFTSAVAERRNLTPARVQELTSGGQIMTSADALEAGLVDGLLYPDQIEDAFRTRLGFDPQEDLEIIYGSDYGYVPPDQAGITIGNAGEIAIVYASGTMTSGESGVDPGLLFSGVTVGSETFADAMNEARESDNVDAIVVRIDSPGGYTPAADEMWHAVRRAAEVKPVIVSMGGYAASGGYWLATAADTIVADPLTLTGSIGVFSIFFDAGDLFEDRLGITFDGVSTSPYADMFSGIRPLSPAERALLERSTQETYRTFLTRVAESRGMSVEAVDSIAQ
ncbi:MAG TPA: signal peptide peptidase SppA, partial [Rhodothermales bacterium]